MVKPSISVAAREILFRIDSELREEEARHREALDKIMANLQTYAEQLANVIPPVDDPKLTHSWIPESKCEKSFQPELIKKIKAIEPSQAQSHLARFRNTWLARFYINHLKQYAFMRSTVIWVWRKSYPYYVNHISSCFSSADFKGWHPLIALNKYVKRNVIPLYKLTDAALIETPVPKVFPVSLQSFLVSPNDKYIFPEIYVATIKNATTYGGTNLILTDSEIICHDLYDFERDSTSEELHGRILIDPKSMQVQWLMKDETPESVAVAATFVDACALNYAHWMTEVLPRIALFCAEEQFHGVPIVVNHGLHKNIMESLFLVTGPEREIITLPIGRALAVGQLFITSVAGYVPFEPRKNKISRSSHGLFSPQAFEILRKHMGGLILKMETESYPDKIYLRRNSNVRKVTNSAALEKLLVARGYTIVEPEKLTFSQQAQLFYGAKIIIGPTGAAFANAVFCGAGAHVAILVSKHNDLAYGYWINMLTPLGINFNYIFGEVVENQDGGFHSNFEVKPSSLEDFLETMERK